MLLRLFLLVSIAALSVEAKIRHHRWDVTYQFKSPDCYQKLAITINGETPGPTIDAQVGDTVVVEVMNQLLTENLAIHWHGIRQIGTPWSDGTEGVTQCPVLPGETFIYKFVVDKAGTYLYHAHYGMQRSAGLYGLIRVAPPAGTIQPFTYDYDRSVILTDYDRSVILTDYDRSVILTDWWHKSTYEQAVGLDSIPFGWVGEPQSILINGRGKFNCSLAEPTSVCNATNPECLPYVLTVIPGKTYLLRIAGITSLSALNFQLEGHDMTVVEADGNYVKPIIVKNITIYSGETYSILFTANQSPDRNYWAAVNVVARKPATPTGVAILNYYPNRPTTTPPTAPPVGPLWNDTLSRLSQSQSLHAHPNYTQPPPPADQTILLLNTQNKVNGHIKWALNNISFTLPETPYLVALKHRLGHVFDASPAPITYDYKSYDIYNVAKYTNTTQSNSIYRLKFNSVVEIVLQNANTMTVNNSETHPWHLHGHDFWVVGYGIGKFDPEVDPKGFNLVDPVMKNTVPLHTYGWTAIRFRANNPGVWAFHCHIESHFFLGMGVVFEEGMERVGRLPERIMGCGASKGLRG